jgi:hypothetical protein
MDAGKAPAVRRTIIYVDGYNLYYRALKGTSHKWLNIKALAERVLEPTNQIVGVRYFTARVSGKPDPTSPRDQQIYLDALATVPEVRMYFGNFQSNVIIRPLAVPIAGVPTYVRVRHSQEKGSDVNLAAHLINDAWSNRFDVAAIISNDTDLCEPIRIVNQELKKLVGVMCPASNCSLPLKNVAKFVKHIKPGDLAASQFPSPLANGKIVKPADW